MLAGGAEVPADGAFGDFTLAIRSSPWSWDGTRSCLSTSAAKPLLIWGVLETDMPRELAVSWEAGRTDSPLAGVDDLELSATVLLVPFVIKVNSAMRPPVPYVICVGL